VAAVGVGIPDAAHDGELVAIPELLQSFQARVEGEPIADGQHLLGPEAQGGAPAQAAPVLVRHHGVEAVVAPVQGQEHQRPPAVGERALPGVRRRPRVAGHCEPGGAGHARRQSPGEEAPAGDEASRSAPFFDRFALDCRVCHLARLL